MQLRKILILLRDSIIISQILLLPFVKGTQYAFQLLPLEAGETIYGQKNKIKCKQKKGSRTYQTFSKDSEKFASKAEVATGGGLYDKVFGGLRAL